MNRVHTMLAALLVVSAVAGAEDLVAVDADALHQRVRDLKAPVVVVNFWASWCLPCRIEFPALTRLRREWLSRGVEVVFVSTDLDDSLPNARAFLQQQKVDWTNYLARDRAEKLIDSFDTDWSGGLPATFVYDRDRQRVAAFHRPVNYEELAAAVRQAGAGKQEK